jgi:hypothetical protein
VIRYSLVKSLFNYSGSCLMKSQIWPKEITLSGAHCSISLLLSAPFTNAACKRLINYNESCFV